MRPGDETRAHAQPVSARHARNLRVAAAAAAAAARPILPRAHTDTSGITLSSPVRP